MADFFTTSRTSITIMERPLGQVRWVRTFFFGKKLQQAWEVIACEGGRPYQQDTEWRDVPTDAA